MLPFKHATQQLVSLNYSGITTNNLQKTGPFYFHEHFFIFHQTIICFVIVCKILSRTNS